MTAESNPEYPSSGTGSQIDYEGKPIFLVDASVFPGSSGSPVVICNHGGFATKAGFSVGTRVLLLGIISSVLVQRDNNLLEFVTVPTATAAPGIRTTQMIDLGVVFKASVIIKTVMDFINKYGIPLA